MCFIPNVTDATSFYRGVGPISALKRQNQDISLIFSNDVNWATLMMSDVVFLQRPYRKSHLQIAQMAQSVGRPVWIDYDDLLFDVPADNPAYRTYMSADTKRIIADLIQLADVVTVSTQQIKDIFQIPEKSLNDRVYVVPNALDDRMFKKRPSTRSNKIITWRGTDTHQRDLMDYAPEIVELSKTNPGWTWNFIGWNPWFITERMGNRAVVTEQIDILEYHAFMQAVAPAIHVVPLHDSLFNRAKSNIAWIEATYAGAATFAPDWLEWQKPGCTTYSGSKEFIEELDRMMHLSPEVLRGFNDESWEAVWEGKLSSITKRRAQILGALLERNEFPEGGEPSTAVIELA